jgi:hypothetical protein
MRGDPAIPPDSRAILIGVPHYQDDQYRSYAAVGNSVDGMYRLLVESGLCGWRAEQVEKISDPVDAGRLLGRLRSLAGATTGVLLLYFVGHGVPSAHTGELCLAIADTDHANPDTTGLEYTKIKKMLYDGTPAATRIVILDCCYSGTVIGLGPGSEEQLAELSSCWGAYTLTAADERAQVPLDGDGNPRTAFTGELLDLLTVDGIPDGPPGMTLGAIYLHLRQRLAAKGLPRPNQRSDDSAAAFVFARNAAPPTAGATLDDRPSQQLVQPPGQDVNESAERRSILSDKHMHRRVMPSYVGRIIMAVGCFFAANFLPIGSGYWTDKFSGVQMAQLTLTFNVLHPFMREFTTGEDAARVEQAGTAWWLAPLLGIGTAVMVILAMSFCSPRQPVRALAVVGSWSWVGFFALVLVSTASVTQGQDVSGLYERDVPQVGGWLLFAASVISAYATWTQIQRDP